MRHVSLKKNQWGIFPSRIWLDLLHFFG
jgi:hypothetical protein